MKIDKKELFYALFLLVIFFICFKSFYCIFLKSSSAEKCFPFYEQQTTAASAGKPTSLYLSVKEAKGLLPENAVIDFSPLGFNIYRIVARYLFYPLPLSKDWAFFIDFEGIVKHLPPGYQVYEMTTGVNLIIKPGHELKYNQSAMHSFPAVKVALIFFVITTINLCLGSFLFRLLSSKKFLLMPGHSLGIAYFVGLIILTIVLWLFLLWGGNFERNALIIVWVVTSFGILIISQDSHPPAKSSFQERTSPSQPDEG